MHGTLTSYSYGCRCTQCRAANAAYQREWSRKNRVRVNAYDKAWSMKNVERRREIGRRAAERYRQRHPEKVREQKRASYSRRLPQIRIESLRLRARRQGADLFDISPRDLHRLFLRHSGKCAYCGDRTADTVDHIVPMRRGGRHSIGNLAPCCEPCNSNKRQRFLVEWRNGRVVARTAIR